MWMYLVPLNSTVKNGQNSMFYIMWLSPQRKKFLNKYFILECFNWFNIWFIIKLFCFVSCSFSQWWLTYALSPFLPLTSTNMSLLIPWHPAATWHLALVLFPDLNFACWEGRQDWVSQQLVSSFSSVKALQFPLWPVSSPDSVLSFSSPSLILQSLFPSLTKTA